MREFGSLECDKGCPRAEAERFRRRDHWLSTVSPLRTLGGSTLRDSWPLAVTMFTSLTQPSADFRSVDLKQLALFLLLPVFSLRNHKVDRLRTFDGPTLKNSRYVCDVCFDRETRCGLSARGRVSFSAFVHFRGLERERERKREGQREREIEEKAGSFREREKDREQERERERHKASRKR